MDMYFCTTLKHKKRQELVTFFTWQHSSSVLALKRCEILGFLSCPQHVNDCGTQLLMCSVPHQHITVSPLFEVILKRQLFLLLYFCLVILVIIIYVYNCSKKQAGKSRTLKAMKHMVSWNEDCAVWVMCTGFGL